MKLKKMLSGVAISLAMVAIFSSMEPCIEVSASSISSVTGYVNGDGVRLRNEGWSGGTILELMYDGESVDYYLQIFGSDPEYNYMKRHATGTYGYVDHHYIQY
ncbi:MAG: hypothetical protein R3Y24_06050 [Eubacteriales bacterium]